MSLRTVFILLLYFITLHPHIVWSQNRQNERLVFKKAREHDGLLHDAVYGILEDKHGYMWFATRSGLQRFDGHQLKAIEPPGDLSGTPAIVGLAQLGGSVLFSQPGELYRVDPLELYPKKILLDFETPRPGEPLKIHSLHTSPQGMVVINAKGQSYFGKIADDTLRLKSIHKTVESLLGNKDFRIKHTRYVAGKLLVFMNRSVLKVPTGPDGLPDFDRCSKYQDVLRGRIVYSYVSDRRLVLLLSHRVITYSLYDLDFKKPEKIIRLETSFSYNSLVEDNNENLWITTPNGLLKIDPSGRKSWSYHDSQQPNSISSNQLTCSFLDSRNILWIGSLRGGVNFMNTRFRGLSHFEVSKYTGHEFPVRSILVTGKNIWLGSLGGEILRIGQDQRVQLISTTSGYVPIKRLEAFDEHKILSIANTANSVLDTRDNTLTPFVITRSNGSIYAPKHITCVAPYSRARLWVSARAGGTQLLKFENNSFLEIPLGDMASLLGKIEANVIYADPLDRGLLVADDRFLYILTCNSQGLPVAVRKSDLPRVSGISMVNERLYAIATLNEGVKLITAGNIWSDSIDPVTPITTINGLSDNRVNDILPAGPDQLILNGREVQLLDLATYKLTHLDLAIDWVNNPIIRGSGYLSQDQLYFGLQDGFVSIDIDKMQPRMPLKDCQITGIDVNSGPSKKRTLQIPANRNDSVTYQVHLNHRENNPKIYFTDFDYTRSHEKIYHYRIKEEGEQWQVTSSHWVNFSHLSPGSYTFEVCTNPGESNLDSIEIVIDPPFYWTSQAKVFYAAILLVVVAIIGYHKRNWDRLRMALRTNEKIHQFKSDFFNQVAHEIRTPLSLVTSPLKELMHSKGFAGDEKEKLQVAQKNSNRLEDLVDRLVHQNFDSLSYSKLKIEYLDINKIIEDILKWYALNLENKNIQVNFTPLPGADHTWGDKHVLRTAICNILDNAIKYSDPSGEIDIRIVPYREWVTLEKAYFLTRQVPHELMGIEIQDHGKGIDPSKVKRIFNRFFQINTITDNGLGMGLSMARDLVHLSHGAIAVRSGKNLGSSFMILVPRKKEAYKTDQMVVDSSPLLNSFNTAKQVHQPAILLVQPDLELKTYLVDQLSSEHTVTAVDDCEAAIEILELRTFDLIISEYYLPNRNGMTLCEWIRNNQDLQLVPFILISSREIDYTKYKNTYVDRHLGKPLDIELLKVNIRSLTDKQKFRSKVQLVDSALKVSIRDDERELARQIITLLINNLSDSSFGVEALSKSLGISNRSLQLKMKKWFKKSPKEFINAYRLEYAADLLRSKKFKINEVAYSSGFNTPAHFSKIFKDKYGVNPSEINDLV